MTRKNVAIRNILILICVLPIICGTFFASKLFISNNTDSEISDSIINTTITGRADNVTNAFAVIDTDDTNVTTSESADTPELEPSAPITTAHSESDNTTAAEHSTEGTPPNDSRSTAWAITLNEKLSEEVLKDESNWYKFTTIAESSVYRIELFPETDQITNTLFPHLYFAVYDSVGIKIDEYYVWGVDTSNFIDLYLEPSTEYFIKVYLGSRFSTGEYSICVSEKLCDAGIDKDNASELILDTRYSASVNSTLSDWYVFNVKETGRYKITLHNIDVGCDIYISAKYSGNAGEGISVKNEDNYSWSINVQEGNPVYFEVYSYNKNPVANGNYIIEIEKVDS